MAHDGDPIKYHERDESHKKCNIHGIKLPRGPPCENEVDRHGEHREQNKEVAFQRLSAEGVHPVHIHDVNHASYRKKDREKLPHRVFFFQEQEG